MHFTSEDDSIKNHPYVSKLLFVFFWPEISFGDVVEVKPSLEPQIITIMERQKQEVMNSDPFIQNVYFNS